MQILRCVLLLFLPFLACGQEASDVEDEVERVRKAEEQLIQLAEQKRGAAIRLTFRKDSRERGGCGVFISDDGLALVSLPILASGEELKVEVADGSSLKFGQILCIFPEKTLALMRFAHRPKHWIPIAPSEPELGEQVALAFTFGNDPHPMQKVSQQPLRPLIGPIMAKRSGLTARLKENVYTRVLSLGVSVTNTHRAASPGAFTINTKGELVALSFDERPTGKSLLVIMKPLSDLTDQITEFAIKGQYLAYPLPPDSNPIDPMTMDEDLPRLHQAMGVNDTEGAWSIYKQLKKRYPDSIQVDRIGSSITSLSGGERSTKTTVTIDPPAAGAPRSIRVDYLLMIAQQKLEEGNSDGCIEALRDAVEIAPKDYPHVYERLAGRCMVEGRVDEGLQNYEAAYQCQPESIPLVKSMNRVYIQKRSWKKANEMTRMLYELERIYGIR